MARETHLRWTAVASLLALAVALVAGAKGKAFWQAGSASEEPAGASSPSAAPGSEHASASPEHGASPGSEESSHEPGAWDGVFQWANFLLIGGAIWYLGRKYGGPLLRQRAEAIRQEMERSARAVAEASERLARIEEKLARLDEEIRALREDAVAEAAGEGQRLEAMTQAEASKILQSAEQEIAATAKAARRELQRYTAELAVGLAERRIRETISPEAEKRIFRSFVQDLNDSAGRRTRSGDSSGS